MQAVRNEFAAAEASGKGSDEVTDWVRSMERRCSIVKNI